MSWRTNKRTRKPFRTDSNYDSDNARIDVAEEPQVESQHELQEVGWTCACCGNNYPSSAQQYDLEGQIICVNCKKIEVSGVLDRETIYDSPKEVPYVSSTDMNHTIKPGQSACAGCNSVRRNLCPCHRKCWDCRPSNCKMKR